MYLWKCTKCEEWVTLCHELEVIFIFCLFVPIFFCIKPEVLPSEKRELFFLFFSFGKFQTRQKSQTVTQGCAVHFRLAWDPQPLYAFALFFLPFGLRIPIPCLSLHCILELDELFSGFTAPQIRVELCIRMYHIPSFTP